MSFSDVERCGNMSVTPPSPTTHIEDLPDRLREREREKKGTSRNMMGISDTLLNLYNENKMQRGKRIKFLKEGGGGR